jgi:hypothetical protein
MIMQINPPELPSSEADSERPPAELPAAQLRIFYHAGPHPSPETADEEDRDEAVVELPVNLEYVDSFLRQRLSLPPRNFDRPLFIAPPELHTFVAKPLLPDPAALLAAATAAAFQEQALEQDQAATDIEEAKMAAIIYHEEAALAAEEAMNEPPAAKESGELFDWLSGEKNDESS